MEITKATFSDRWWG